MESVYPPDLFRSSDHVDLKSYFEKFQELITPVDHDILANNSLAEACSIDRLTISGEPSWLPIVSTDIHHATYKLDCPYPVTPAAKLLNVVRVRENMEPTKSQEQLMLYNKRFFRSHTLVSKDTPSIGDIRPGTEFIYSIIVYKPFAIRFAKRNSSDNLRYAFELEALGSNKISDIADKISCSTNYGLMKKVENTTDDLSHLLNAKAHYPSQTIFIDGVFYNDTRLSGNIDYSEKIIPWAASKGIGEFTTAQMQNTSLDSLTPRLGYPYVYIHQGNCEHIFCFSDAKLISKFDTLFRRNYPRMIGLARQGSIICFICRKAQSKWLVADCDRFPHKWVFLCTQCCNSYLFIDGQKVTTFDLYPYFDREFNN